MSVTTHKVLLIDDEINNVALLEHFVSKYCLGVKVIGHALTIPEAISKIKSDQPDILFLDIKLNEGDAFDILDTLGDIKAQIIFVTSYNEYAIKAFKYNAIDYILKPVVIEEIILAVNKAIKNIQEKRYFDFQKIEALSQSKEKSPENKDCVAIAHIDKIELLKTAEVIYVEAVSRYSIFHTKDGKKHMASKNIGYFEKILDNTTFFRIHNTHIVNINHIVTIIKTDGYYCEMDTGQLLPISRRRQEGLGKFLKVKFK